MKQALTKKLGPMPRWAWLAIAVVVVGYLYYRSRQNAANSSQSSTDPYSSYNTQGYVDQGLPYGDTASAGGYPLSLGGGGFDPTSFYQGLQYGAVTAAGLGSTTNPVAGTTNTPATDNSIPNPVDNSGAGQEPVNLPIASGDNTTAISSGGSTGSAAGSRAVSTKKTPTKKSTTKPTGSTSHLAGAPHTSTGGGMPTRSTTTHTNTPSGGVHPTGSTSALAGGGIATNPGRTVVTPHPAAPTVQHPPQKPKPKPKPPRPTGSTSRRAATR